MIQGYQMNNIVKWSKDISQDVTDTILKQLNNGESPSASESDSEIETKIDETDDVQCVFVCNYLYCVFVSININCKMNTYGYLISRFCLHSQKNAKISTHKNLLP